MGEKIGIDVDEMVRDRADGMSTPQIARKHGCSEANVRLRLKRADGSPEKADAPANLDPEMEAISTAVFRKVLGYCPIADGPRL